MSAYRAPTTALRELLDHADRLTGAEVLALNEAYDLALGVPTYRYLQRPRAYAWFRLHQTLREHQRMAAFDDLFRHLEEQHLGTAGHVIRDAACATLAHDLTDRGPFTTADHDVLLAPWRAVVERCARSRLALELTSRWPHPADDLWPLVDAILINPAAHS